MKYSLVRLDGQEIGSGDANWVKMAKKGANLVIRFILKVFCTSLWLWLILYITKIANNRLWMVSS